MVPVATVETVATWCFKGLFHLGSEQVTLAICCIQGMKSDPVIFWDDHKPQKIRIAMN